MNSDESSMQRPPALTPQQAALTSGSPIQLYKEMAVGREASLLHLLRYELSLTLLSNLPGIIGLGSRSLLYPGLFRCCGSKPAFGRGVVLRNPRKVDLGNRVLVDDFSVLDVRGDNATLTLGDYVSIGRFSTIAAKGGSISLGAGSNIGSYCRLATQSKIALGESVLIGAYCYIGPGNHQQGDEATPLISREMEIKGGVSIGSHAWIGAGVTVLDGVTIGEGAIIGAQSLVMHDVPAGATAVGTPAKLL